MLALCSLLSPALGLLPGAGYVWGAQAPQGVGGGWVPGGGGGGGLLAGGGLAVTGGGWSAVRRLMQELWPLVLEAVCDSAISMAAYVFSLALSGLAFVATAAMTGAALAVFASLLKHIGNAVFAA